MARIVEMDFLGALVFADDASMAQAERLLREARLAFPPDVIARDGRTWTLDRSVGAPQALFESSVDALRAVVALAASGTIRCQRSRGPSRVHIVDLRPPPPTPAQLEAQRAKEAADRAARAKQASSIARDIRSQVSLRAWRDDSARGERTGAVELPVGLRVSHARGGVVRGLRVLRGASFEGLEQACSELPTIEVLRESGGLLSALVHARRFPGTVRRIEIPSGADGAHRVGAVLGADWAEDLEGLLLDAQHYVQFDALLASRCRLRRLELKVSPEKLARLLREASWATSLERLRFSAPGLAFDDATLEALLRCALPRLRDLAHPSSRLVAPAGARWLSARWVAGLRRLDAGFCSLDADAMRALAQRAEHLEWLRLAGNPIGDEGLGALAAAPGLAQLAALDVEGCALTQADSILADAVFPASARVPRLRDVDW